MLRPDLSWWSAARAEIDQRARETRLRLEQLERLLISRVLPTQGSPGQLDHRRGPRFFRGGRTQSRSAKITPPACGGALDRAISRLRPVSLRAD